MNLVDFLATKPLYYSKIDLDRIPEAYGYVRTSLDLGRVVHIIGTNGKGTTGRMLALLLRDAGYRVGHYTSPHIRRFNERIWIDGTEADDASLERAHRKLLALLPQAVAESLSYFEYTTLLALVRFGGVQFTLLEAGLGGEFDATNVVDKELSVATPVGMDHEAFLGESIEAIAATKLRSMQARLLLAEQPFAEVAETARAIAAPRGTRLYYAQDMGDARSAACLRHLAQKGRPEFLCKNAETALAAAKILGIPVRCETLETWQPEGRMQPLSDRVFVDVGHNPLAAQAVFKALGAPVVLVYNALADKDAASVLKILAPKVEHVEIIEIAAARAMEREQLEAACAQVNLACRKFEGIEPGRDYLAFGSFYVVEAFLKQVENGFSKVLPGATRMP